MELYCSWVVLFLALSPLLLRLPHERGPVLATAGGVATFAVVCLVYLSSYPVAPTTDLLPLPVQDEGFIASDACRSCHPAQYITWHATYHRTMTQAATPRTVLAPFDSVVLEQRGRIYRLGRRGDQFWVDMVDPAWEISQTLPGFDPGSLDNPPRIEQPVVMATGSHHLQVYWVAASHKNGMYYQIPWAYQIEEKRWIPAADSFLRPASQGPVEIEVWNTTCVDCHSVGGQPRMDPESKSMFSRAAEIGIACEACHRPAEIHVRSNRDPIRRYALHLRGGADPTIVNPKRTPSRRSAQICGQCHSVSGPLDPEQWMRRGRTYRAGDSLEASRRIVRYTETPSEPWLLAWLNRNPDELAGRFWEDGTVRVAGREFNGLIESACYKKGDLSCITCHSMHRSDPNDQLAAGKNGDEACLPCHGKFRNNIEAHSHHRAGSTGSLCYNCHMPYTTYGLFVAMRSHRIDNPSVEISLRTGRPNACNLCHLNRTLAWTSEYLSKWYGSTPVPVKGDEKEVAASILWLLRGDAAQRAIVAWSMGWQAARAVSDQAWLIPYLAQLLDDPYSAVRMVAYKSLRQILGYEELKYDFVAARAERLRARDDIIAAWGGRRDRTGVGKPEILMDARGRLVRDRFDHLLKQRDDKPIRIIE